MIFPSDTSRNDGSNSANQSALLPQIRGCIQAVLGLTDEEAAGINLETTPLQLPRWTSLGHLQLVLELERSFGVTFEADDIAALASVAAIVEALERRKAES